MSSIFYKTFFFRFACVEAMAILSRFASAGCRSGVPKVLKSQAARPALLRLLPPSQVLSTGVTRQKKVRLFAAFPLTLLWSGWVAE